VIIATEPGGSGTFYYVAVAELDGGAYAGSAGVLLGDRIAPQHVTFADGVVTIDYAERRPGEPMSVPPSVTASKRFVIATARLQPLEPDKRFYQLQLKPNRAAAVRRSTSRLSKSTLRYR
jgi:hypothetical protein